MSGKNNTPLVLVHGYFGGAAVWCDQLEAFSNDRDVIALDLKGYAERSSETGCDSIQGFACDILRQLDERNVQKFDLMGHSMGGMIVQEMAAQAPQRISKLICYGTGPVGVLPDRFETIETSRQRVRSEGVKPTARRIAATWFKDGEAHPRFEDCAILNKDVSLETALNGLTAMESWDGRPALGNMKKPGLVIWGDGDRSYGWPQPEAIWRGIPGCQLAVLPGCAHNAHIEKPGLFNALVSDFLEG